MQTTDLIKGLSENISADLKEIQRSIGKSLIAVTEQWQDLTFKLAESLRLQLDYFAKGLKKHSYELSKLAEEFAEQCKVAEQKVAPVLQKYKWLVSNSLPLPFVFELIKIGLRPGRQDAAINKLFIDYFSLNNWQSLDAMVLGWKGLIRKERWDILMDCVNMLKQTQSKKINQVNVILPTLIAQADGIWDDYLKKRGVPSIVGNKRKEQFKRIKPSVLPGKLDDIASNVFLEILFQKSLKGEKLERSFNFNRHKIMHGENVRYGRKDYLIRAFLILDFLSHLD